jgi:glycosyltransferase involved in cell wall biosynthesis
VAGAPLISVVIPCYNQAHFLREAIDSAVSSADAIEVIVIDDGSTDCTAEVVEAIGPRERVEVRYVRQANGGLADARNRGLRESRGRYVVFLDADDRLTADALDVGLAALESHPDRAFVFGRCLMMSSGGVVLPTPGQPLITSDHYPALLRRNYIWTPAMVMYRREAIEEAGGFDPAVNAAADYDLHLRIARQHAVHDHGQVVAHYRRHDGNMSSNASRMLRETLAVMRGQRDLIGEDAVLREAYREGWRTWQDFYGTHLVNEIRAHVAAGEWLRALRKALTLGRYHPRGLAHHAMQKLRVTFHAAVHRQRKAA